MQEPQGQLHSTWDGEDVVDEEYAEDRAVAEDVANAHHLQPTCKPSAGTQWKWQQPGYPDRARRSGNGWPTSDASGSILKRNTNVCKLECMLLVQV